MAETVDAVDRFFDLVLVHGDPRLAPFDDSFPDAPAFADIMAYTGLVVPPARASRPPAERFAVVVSAGGGAVGWQFDAARKGGYALSFAPRGDFTVALNLVALAILIWLALRLRSRAQAPTATGGASRRRATVR